MPNRTTVNLALMLLVFLISACGQENANSPDTKTEPSRASASVNDKKAPSAINAYAPCTVCHQADGQGVPAAFPPIRNRASQMAGLEGGRAYLVNVVSNGITGPIKVGAQSYSGVMPGHSSSMSPEQIAQVLNYVVFELSDSGSGDSISFTADYVAQIQQSIAGKSMQDTAKLRAELVAQHGDSWPN